MEVLKSLLVQYFILTKRFLRSPGFVAVIVLIPLILLAMGIVSSGKDSGIITVALSTQDEKDELANKIISELTENSGLIRFITCVSEEDAVYLVKTGKAEAAWIFADNLEERIDKFSKHTHKNNAFVTVIQREDNVGLRFVREKLNTVFYPYISVAVYRNFVSEAVINLSELSDRELDSFYQAVHAGGEDLFEFKYADKDGGAGKLADTDDQRLLVSPLRGLLAVVVVVAGIGAAMLYIQDEERGVFDRLPHNCGFSFCVVYYAAAVLIAGVAVILALSATRMAAGIGFEIVAMLLYCTCTTAFCICLRFVLSDIRVFGAVTPIIIIATAVLCPIFFAAPNMPIVQYLLPTYYYIRALTEIKYLWHMAIYTVILWALAYILYFMHARKPKAERRVQ